MFEIARQIDSIKPRGTYWTSRVVNSIITHPLTSHTQHIPRNITTCGSYGVKHDFVIANSGRSDVKIFDMLERDGNKFRVSGNFGLPHGKLLKKWNVHETFHFEPHDLEYNGAWQVIRSLELFTGPFKVKLNISFSLYPTSCLTQSSYISERDFPRSNR